MKNKVETLLAVCDAFATNSHSTRAQVGAIIATPQGVIISSGYNGSLPDTDNCLECSKTGETLPTVIHAEMNAIYHAAKNGLSGIKGMHLYCSHSPCERCASAIISVGITRVVYRIPYRLTEGVDLLKQHIEVYQYQAKPLISDAIFQANENAQIRFMNGEG